MELSGERNRHSRIEDVHVDHFELLLFLSEFPQAESRAALHMFEEHDTGEEEETITGTARRKKMKFLHGRSNPILGFKSPYIKSKGAADALYRFVRDVNDRKLFETFTGNTRDEFDDIV